MLDGAFRHHLAFMSESVQDDRMKSPMPYPGSFLIVEIGKQTTSAKLQALWNANPKDFEEPPFPAEVMKTACAIAFQLRIKNPRKHSLPSPSVTIICFTAIYKLNKLIVF